MKITRIAEAKAYDAPGHVDVAAVRLQGLDATPARLCVVGLSHYQPGAIAKMSASAEEKIYVVLDGEITVELADGARHVLARHDSCLIEPGDMREVRNESGKIASLLVLMPA